MIKWLKKLLKRGGPQKRPAPRPVRSPMEHWLGKGPSRRLRENVRELLDQFADKGPRQP